MTKTIAESLPEIDMIMKCAQSEVSGGCQSGCHVAHAREIYFYFFYSPFFLITFNRSTCNSVSVYLYAFVILNSPELASLLLVGPNI